MNGYSASRKLRCLPALLIILLSLACLSVPAHPSATDQPADTPESAPTPTRARTPLAPTPLESSSFAYVMGNQLLPPPDLPMPAKGTAFADPRFHTPLVRVTDKKSDGYIDPGIQNEYSKVDPENKDGTLLILRGNSAAFYLYDALTFQPLRQLTIFDACEYAEPEPRWDASDPLLFYYSCGATLRAYHTGTGEVKILHDFKKDFSKAAVITTGSEGDASLDRRYFCYMVKDSNYALLAVITYDRIAQKILGKKTSGFPDSLNWVGMSMSGSRCLVGYEDVAMYTDAYNREMNAFVRLPEGSAGHGDAAQTASGRDVYVYQNVRTDWIAMADLETGMETPLVRIPFDTNPDIGLHISGNCAQPTGWVLVSTYGAKTPPEGKSHSWMDNALFMLELKANGRIWRVAHTQAYTGRTPAEKNYYAEAFAAITTRGTRVYWGSNWSDFREDYSEAYAAILPVNWGAKIP
ncbi:MAG TPA: hypothetical protein VIO61_03010 [Anaerolineaceae bacterium]